MPLKRSLHSAATWCGAWVAPGATGDAEAGWRARGQRLARRFTRADAAAAQAALDGARVAVAAETARTYAQACGFAAQADVARETARLQDQTLDLTRRLLDAGRGTRRDVDQAIVLAENARAQAPTFEAERRASLYALATLTGRPPAEAAWPGPMARR